MTNNAEKLTEDYGLGKRIAEVVAVIMTPDQIIFPLSYSLRLRIDKEAQSAGMKFLAATTIQNPPGTTICLYYLSDGWDSIEEFQFDLNSTEPEAIELELFRMLVSNIFHDQGRKLLIPVQETRSN